MYELFYFVALDIKSELFVVVLNQFSTGWNENGVNIYEIINVRTSLFVEIDVRVYELFYDLATPKTVFRAAGRGFQGKVRKIYEMILKIANVRN